MYKLGLNISKNFKDYSIKSNAENLDLNDLLIL